MPLEKVRKVLKISKEPVSLEKPVGDEEDSSLGDFIEDTKALAPLELAIKSGAEDCLSNQNNHEILIKKESFYKVKQEIEKKIHEFVSSGIEWMPMNKISLDNEKTKSVLSFLEVLEDDDDVQHVYANLEIDNNYLQKISR